MRILRYACAWLALTVVISGCAPHKIYPVVVRESISVLDRAPSRPPAARGATSAAPPAPGTSGTAGPRRNEVGSSGRIDDVPTSTDGGAIGQGNFRRHDGPATSSAEPITPSASTGGGSSTTASAAAADQPHALPGLTIVWVVMAAAAARSIACAGAAVAMSADPRILTLVKPVRGSPRRVVNGCRDDSPRSSRP